MKVTDHFGKTIQITSPPKRIVSLVPSITELLHDLGLQDQIVGRTKFCIFPTKGYPCAKVIGGTKNVHINLVKELNPDLVIANKEENVKDQVEEILKFSSTFTTVVKTRDDALKMIKDIGIITSTETKANHLIKELNNDFEVNQTSDKIKVLYLIWKDPYMTVGGDTFISHFLSCFGFENCYSHQQRYPSIDLNDIDKIAPDLIMCSSEPFPFNESHAKEITDQTGIKTILVDGSYCSWYGSRMLKSQNYLRQLSNKLA